MQSACLSVCLSVHEHISGTAGLILTKYFVQIPCDCGWVLLWQHCDTLCTSGYMDDVTFGRNGPYGDAWKAEPLTYYHYRHCDTGAESDVYECLVYLVFIFSHIKIIIVVSNCTSISSSKLGNFLVSEQLCGENSIIIHPTSHPHTHTH